MSLMTELLTTGVSRVHGHNYHDDPPHRLRKRRHRWNPNKRRASDGLTSSSSNGDRANVAAAAVLERSRLQHEAEVVDEAGIHDLLADLAHLCDREDIDFEATLRAAIHDWEAER